MNIFNPINQDRQYIFNTMGKDILINGNSAKAIIKHVAPNNNYDDLEIITLTPITRGDMIQYNNQKYLILSEVTSDRNGKYKAFIRLCAFHIKIAINEQGEPLQWGEYDLIVQNPPNFFLQNGSSVTYVDGQMQIIIKYDKDNPLTVGLVFPLAGSWWKIISFDYTKKGLSLLQLDKTTQPTDYPDGYMDGLNNPIDDVDDGETSTNPYDTTGDPALDEFVANHVDLGDPNDQSNTNYWKYEITGYDELNNPIYDYVRKTLDQLKGEYDTPIAPTGLTVNATDFESVTITWNSVQYSSGYNVYRDGSIISSNQTATTYADTGLTGDTTYTYQVSTINSVGESPLTDSVSVTTPEEPSTPTPKYATTGDAQIDQFVLRHQGDNGSTDLGDPNNQDNTNYWKTDITGYDELYNPIYEQVRKTYDELVSEFES